MSKFKVVNLIDKIFITFVVFLILFAWINFYLRNLWTTFVLSVFLSLSIVFILYSFINKKEKTKSSNLTKKQEIEINFLAFNLLSKKNKLALIAKILSIENKIKIESEVIQYENNKNHLVILATDYESINEHTLINILSKYEIENFEVIEIICNECEKFNENLIKNKKILITNKQKLYEDYFLKFNTFPDKNSLNLEIPKIRLKDILKGMFSKNKSKGYFFCGFVLIFSSIILPFTTYYLISGTILLIFSLICKITKFHSN